MIEVVLYLNFMKFDSTVKMWLTESSCDQVFAGIATPSGGREIIIKERVVDFG